MAKVELSYNPYLLETIALINGNNPRINSLIEKYKKGSIYNWVDEMPKILHDEMNGYDFQLDFSGTDKDYKAIEKAFSTVPDVEVFHKNKLDSRLDKNAAINELLRWLSENPNHMFSYEEFKENNAELYDTTYPLLVLNGGKIDKKLFDGLNVSVDNIEDLSNVEDADLTNMPILICLDNDSVENLENNLEILMSRNDVRIMQLFFMVHPKINKKRVERNIKDIGIAEPIVIDSQDLTPITDYMELFPITDYIRKAISVFKKSYETLRNLLESKLKENEVEGETNRTEIEVLTDGIERLKNAHEKLDNRDNLNISQDCRIAIEELRLQIKEWRKRKTKITNEEDAEKYAKEFKNYLTSIFQEYIQTIDSIFMRQINILENIYLDILKKTGFIKDFKSEIDYPLDVEERIRLPRYEDYMRLKRYENNTKQVDFFDVFFNSTPTLERVNEVTYYNQDWRDYAEENIIPKAEFYLNEKFRLLRTREKLFVENLTKQIEELIDTETQKKEHAVSMMSSTEKNLQIDVDWLGELNDMLEEIMRG